MGSEQSTNRAGASAAAPTEDAASRKTCYYDILGLSSLATDEEIRRAYKRKALELHPDRNISDVERATKRFAEFQTAYEVLSDPHERAWYDSHRDAILRGDDNVGEGGEEPGIYYNVKLTTADQLFSMIGKFDNSIPMTDASDGFYGVIAETFDHLAMEEVAASQAEGIDILEYPSFGKAVDSYPDIVRPFYAVWSSFSTHKTFAWKDKHRLSEAPDRRMRRLMERENKKCRSEAARDFNDAVRSVVQFARKRDKRYIAGAVASGPHSEEAMRKAAAVQSARARAANKKKMGATSAYVVPDWVRSGNDGDNEGEFSESEDESVVEEIECVICDKIFKTERAFESHEKSKKHLKAVQTLRWQMRKDDKDLHLDTTQGGTDSKDRKDSSTQASSVGIDSEDGDIREMIPISESIAPQREEEAELEAQTLETMHIQKEDPVGTPTTDLEQDSDYASREAIQERLDGTEPQSNQNDLLSDLAKGVEQSTLQDEDVPKIELRKKVGKAKLKRQKRAASKQGVEKDDLLQNKCGVCSNAFPSRTKLFKHIKDSRHAQSITTYPSQSKSNDGKNK